MSALGRFVRFRQAAESNPFWLADFERRFAAVFHFYTTLLYEGQPVLTHIPPKLEKEIEQWCLDQFGRGEYRIMGSAVGLYTPDAAFAFKMRWC